MRTTYPRLAGALLVIVGLWVVQASIPRAATDLAAGQRFRRDASCDRARLAIPPAVVSADGLCRMEALRFTERYARANGRTRDTWVLLARDTAGGTQAIPLSTGRKSAELAGSLRPGDQIRVLRYRAVAAPTEIVAVASGRSAVIRAGHPPDVAFWFDAVWTVAGLVTLYGGAWWLRTGRWHPLLPTP